MPKEECCPKSPERKEEGGRERNDLPFHCLGLSSPTLSSKPKWFSLLCLKGILTWKEMDLSAWSISQWEAEMSLRSNCLGPEQDMSSHLLGPWRHCSAPKAAVFLKEKKKRLSGYFLKTPGRSSRGSCQALHSEMEISGNVLAPPNLWTTPCSGPEVSCKTADPTQSSPFRFTQTTLNRECLCHWSRTASEVMGLSLYWWLWQWCCDPQLV